MKRARKGDSTCIPGNPFAGANRIRFDGYHLSSEQEHPVPSKSRSSGVTALA